MDELAVHLVVEGNDGQATIAAFHRGLVILVVVHDAAVREQVGLVVLVGEVLRAVHDQILGPQSRVE